MYRSIVPNKMNTTVLKEVLAFVFGRKYYANIVATKGTTKQEICSYVFCTRAAANRHHQEIDASMSFLFIETISFRSRIIDFASTIKS